jgi:hypothetical protein
LTKNDLLNLALAADIKLVNYTGRARKYFFERSHLLGTRCTRLLLNKKKIKDNTSSITGYRTWGYFKLGTGYGDTTGGELLNCLINAALRQEYKTRGTVLSNHMKQPTIDA